MAINARSPRDPQTCTGCAASASVFCLVGDAVVVVVFPGEGPTGDVLFANVVVVVTAGVGVVVVVVIVAEPKTSSPSCRWEAGEEYQLSAVVVVARWLEGVSYNSMVGKLFVFVVDGPKPPVKADAAGPKRSCGVVADDVVVGGPPPGKF